MMSMSRLCVRISKCSRLSLYLWGDRITTNTFFSVGRRHRAHDRGASTLYGVHDLARRSCRDLVVIRLEPDADLLSRHAVLPLLVQIRRRSPHSGVSQPLCSRSLARTDVLSKDLGHIARPIRDGTHGPPQIRWQPCHSVRVPPTGTNPGGVSHVKPPTEWRTRRSIRRYALTVTKKLPYPALGRVATGDASQRHENQRYGLR